MPIGACSRGYKLRSREGKSPKSLCVDESSWCSFSGYGVRCLISFLLSFRPHVYGVSLSFYSSSRAGVQGL
jgi:hypothetical protein